MQILDYNRVVKDISGLSKEQLMTRLSEKFVIVQKPHAYRPKALHTFGMYLDKQWFELVAKPGTFNDEDPIGQLDVTILSKKYS